MVSEHNLGSTCEDITSMLSEEEEASHRKEKAHRRDKGKSPLFGEMEGMKFLELLLQTMQELKREIKGMGRERHENPSRRFTHEEISIYSYYVCEHSATQSNIQHGTMHTFLAREEEEGETPKEHTLGDYLQEYESQSKIFKEHLSFPEFC